MIMQDIPISFRAVIIQDGKVLTLRREFDDQKTIWVFPGGHIDKSDDNEKEALKRECLEEVNLQIEVKDKIFEQNYKNTINHFFLCAVIEGNASYGNGPEYTKPELYHGSHDPEWLPIEDLGKYDLKPNKLRDRIIKGCV